MKDKLFKKIKNKKEAGFTIIESLVAIFILVLSITGPMTFTQSGLRAAFVSRDQITAFYLAQDAIEYIKNVRDNNSINILNGNNSIDWLNELEVCFVDLDVSIDNQSGCSVDTADELIRSCDSSQDGCLGPNADGSNDNPLKISNNPTVGYLGFSGTSDSIFSREIKMVQVDPAKPNEVEINVFIRWNTNETIGVRQIVVKEYMYNWATGF